MENSNQLLSLYFNATHIWKRFCEEHTTLYELTLKEYAYLLKSKIQEIEDLHKKKEQTIAVIHHLESSRKKLIDQLNEYLNANKIISVKSVQELIAVMQEFESFKGYKHLERFNQYLIDLIEKIQGENKKNQILLNKLILNLKEIRDELTGPHEHKMYNPQGMITTAVK